MAREVGGTTRIDLGDGASLEVRRLAWREEMALRKRHPAPEGDAAKAETPEQVSIRNADYALDGVASCVVAIAGFSLAGAPVDVMVRRSVEEVVASLTASEFARVHAAVFGAIRDEETGLKN
ncbi:MAG: hypothetical protein ACHQ1G_00050 [Planctomycetota bacterium]